MELPGLGTALTLKFTSVLEGFLRYESGTVKAAQNAVFNSPAAAAGDTVKEWLVKISYVLAEVLAQKTTLSLNYSRQTVAGTDTSNYWRVELNYSW